MYGIGRKITMGIGVERTYGTPTGSRFVMALLDVPKIEPVQMSEEDNAALQSSYGVDDVANTVQMAKISVNAKVDEDQLPLFFLHKYEISTSTVSGETGVYKHILDYSNTNVGTNTAQSFTLFIDDPDRTKTYSPGCIWSSAKIVLEKGYIRVEAEAIGRFPVTWTGSNTITQPKTFVGRNATFGYSSTPSAVTATNILTAAINNNFNASGDDTNFVLGSADLSRAFTTVDRIELEVSALFGDFNLRDDYVNKTRKRAEIDIIDTGRTVTGSVATTRPEIKFILPVAKIISWEQDGGLDDIQKQNVTLLAIDEVGTAQTPMRIEVTNSIPSY